MKYTFGIMSNKFELESNDEIIAKVSMCIFFKSSAPIAIYSPKSEAIDPAKILIDNKEYSSGRGDEIKECLASINNVHDRQNDIDNIVDNQGKLGKLKFVGKVRGEFTCVDCKKDFPIGSPCYDQSDYTGGGFFPEKIRMCEGCGKIKIKGGAEVKVKKTTTKKVKNKEDVDEKSTNIKKQDIPKKKEIVIDPKNGCGKDTEYPKPNKSGVWKCGEKAPVIGIMHCKDCGGLK